MINDLPPSVLPMRTTLHQLREQCDSFAVELKSKGTFDKQVLAELNAIRAASWKMEENLDTVVKIVNA